MRAAPPTFRRRTVVLVVQDATRLARLNAPGFVEAVWFTAGRLDERILGCPIMVCLDFCGRDIADWSERAIGVERGHSFLCRKLDCLERPPRRAPVDDLGFVETIHALCQRVFVTATLAGYRRLDADFRNVYVQRLAVLTDADTAPVKVALLE